MQLEIYVAQVEKKKKNQQVEEESGADWAEATQWGSEHTCGCRSKSKNFVAHCLLLLNF